MELHPENGVLSVLYRRFRRRLFVALIIIGKVADQTACKRRKVLKTGAFVICQYLTEKGRRVVGFELDVSGSVIGLSA